MQILEASQASLAALHHDAHRFLEFFLLSMLVAFLESLDQRETRDKLHFFLLKIKKINWMLFFHASNSQINWENH